MRRNDVILAIAPPALWAVAYTLAKPATAVFPPLLLTSMAYALTALVLFRPREPRLTRASSLVLAATLGCTVQSALIFSGIARVSATIAILAVQAEVPFALLAAWAIGQERIDRGRAIGVLVALGGVAVVVGWPHSLGQITGLALIVLGTLSWGSAQALIRSVGRDSGARTMGAMSAIAAPQLLALSLLLESGQAHAILHARARDWLGLAVLVVAGFILAYTIWYGLLGRYRVDQVAPFALLMPIIGVGTSVVLLGEHPTRSALAGGAVIVSGLALVVRSRPPSTAP